KERDSESQLDYFGARYYDKAQYRFISVDPMISPWTIERPQRWNLYSYCGNNPETYVDPDGRVVFIFYIRLPIDLPFIDVKRYFYEIYGKDRDVAGFWHGNVKINADIKKSDEGVYSASVTITANYETILTRASEDNIWGFPGMPKSYGDLVAHEAAHTAVFGAFLRQVFEEAEKLESIETESELRIIIAKALFLWSCQEFRSDYDNAQKQIDKKKAK
ncbi:MAG: RHS repeat-associated core domain-containing protein, partial [Methanosarcinaceae archaeon]|nr:RHS repeat-associated core domain-containing protein [Methanosarcinaceae archaeon]